MRFADVRAILERAGYQLVRVRGSHHVFEKAGQQICIIPVHRGKVKPAYVRQILKLAAEEPTDE